MDEGELQTLVRFFKTLADENRLRILGILGGQECSVEELAARLSLTPPTVSHHLNRLKELGVLRMRVDGTSHVYALDPEALRALNKTVLAPVSPEGVASLVDDPAAGDAAWERKVLRDFFDGERLKDIPASRKKRSVILRWLAGRFDPKRRYPEREVNEVIKRHHEDSATLRRELVGAGLMQREGGIYWRPPGDAAEAPPRKWAY